MRGNEDRVGSSRGTHGARLGLIAAGALCLWPVVRSPAGSTIGIGRIPTTCVGDLVEVRAGTRLPVVVTTDSAGVSIVSQETAASPDPVSNAGWGNTCRFTFPAHGDVSLETRGFCYPQSPVDAQAPTLPGSGPSQGPFPLPGGVAPEFDVEARYFEEGKAEFAYEDPIAGEQREWSIEIVSDARAARLRHVAPGAGGTFEGSVPCRTHR